MIFTFITSLWWQYWCFNTLWFGVVGEVGCSYCGGLGHRIADCPKLEAIQTKQAQNIGRRDYLAHSSADYWTVYRTDLGSLNRKNNKIKTNWLQCNGYNECTASVSISYSAKIAIPMFWSKVDCQELLVHILCSIFEEHRVDQEWICSGWVIYWLWSWKSITQPEVRLIGCSWSCSQVTVRCAVDVNNCSHDACVRVFCVVSCVQVSHL